KHRTVQWSLPVWPSFTRSCAPANGASSRVRRLRHAAGVVVHQQPPATALFKYVRRKRGNVQQVTVRAMRVHFFDTYDPGDVVSDRYLRIVHHNREILVPDRMVRITFLYGLPTEDRCFTRGMYDGNRSV